MARRGTASARAVTAAALAATAIVVVPAAGASATSSGAGTVTCGDDGTPAVVALQDQHFYVDSSSTVTLLSGYAGYSVRAGQSARSNLWIGYSDFTGGVLSLAPQQSATTALPDLASGATAAEYVLLTATGPTTTPQGHTVTLYDGPPGTGVPICSRSFTYADVVDTIKALANKVTSVTASAAPATAQIGDAVTVTVVGNTGTLGAGPGNDPGVLDYTPNALTGFPASAWRLERTELTISPDGVAPPVTFVDRLYLSGASGPARDYTARYTFRAVGPTSTAAALKPIQYIASGTQVKHTDQGGTALYALPTVSTVAAISLRKQLTAPASGVLPNGGGTAGYRVTVSNSAGHTTDLDWIDDTMPSGAQFVPGSLAIDGHPAADPRANGRDLSVPGPLPVPASGTTTLTYSLQLDATPGRRVNSVAAHYGDVLLDATPDVTDDAAAEADVTVLGAATPNLVDDAVSTPANTPIGVDVLGNDSSPSGLPLHVSAVGTASSGTAVLSPDGTVTFTPAAGTSGRATFTYSATDGYATSQATVTVTVAPVTARDLYSTGKNVTLTASSVLTNDSCTSCTVSATLVSPPASGTVTMASNGTFTYVPASNQTGTVTFTYRASDPVTGLTADGSVTINVADLAPDYATTPYATQVSIPVQANDPGCTNGCKPQAGTAPSRGTVTYSGGTAVYAPTGTLWGRDSFTYGITGNTGSSTIPVTVLVGPPATAATTTYGTSVAVPLPANGSCTTCVYALASAAAHGAVAVDSGTGTATYQPGEGFAGTDSFTYQVKDSSTGLRINGTVTVTVGPKAVDDAASVLLGGSVAGNAAGNDFCAGTCTFTKLSDPATGTLTWNPDGTWSYQPGTAIGRVSFRYQIAGTSAGSGSDTGTVTITVTGAQDDTVTTPVDTAVSVDVRANDPCAGCGLTAVSTPTSGTAAIAGNTVEYTPATGFTGRATFGYTLTHGSATTTATVTVTVLPQANDDTATTVAGGSVQVLPLANDLCSGCTLTGADAPTSGTVGRSGDVVTFTPSGLGTASFGYDAIDAWGDEIHGTVTVTVVAAPSLTDDAVTTRSDTPVVSDVLANDDCAGCTVVISGDPRHGTAVVDVDGTIRYFAAPGFSGLDQLTYVATSPSGAWAQAQLTVTVTPVAHDDSAMTGVGRPVTVDVLANDDCTACTVTIDSVTGAAVADVGSAQVEVTPTAGWSGTVTVQYTAADPSTGASAGAVASIEVSDARPDSATVGYGASVTALDVLANDDCSGCTMTGLTTPSAGTATAGATTVGWTPASGFAGLATFGYTAADGAGHAVSSTVRILATPDVQHVDTFSGVATPITVVPAADCPGCTVTLTTPPANGDLDSDGVGGFSYASADGWTGDDTFAYRITDPVSGRSVTSSVTVSVAAQQAPLAALSVTAQAPDPGPAPTAGQQLTWTWALTNTGNVALTDLASAATDPGSCATALPTTLGIGGGTECTTTHLLTQGELDAGSVAVTAPFTAASTAGPASATGESSVPLAHAAAISLSATAAIDSSAVVGASVTLTYTVTDDGNTSVSGIGVALSDGTPLSCASTTLEPTGSTSCTTTHVLTQGDLDSGAYASDGTATASSPGGADDLTATANTITSLPRTSPPSSSGAPAPSTTSSTSAAPSSSAPAPSSSAPAPSSSAAVPSGGDTGAVTGLVWFDRNSNGVPDAGEWPLPAVTVRLVPDDAAAAGTDAVHRDAVAPAGMHRALPAGRSTADTISAVSDSQGRYYFDHVIPGRYLVVAAVQLAGFSYTSDTDGGTDWSVRAVVDAGRTSVARFAGLGKGTLVGSVYIAGTDAAVAHAQVRCTWAGYDDTAGTADDVTITTTADAHGHYAIPHVPYGFFSCTGVDPATGRTSSTVHAAVHSAHPVQAPLPLRNAADGARAQSHHARSLASTGTPTWQLLRISMALAMAGIGALWLGRRRLRRH